MKNRFSKEDRSGLFFLAALILLFIGSRIITARSLPHRQEIVLLEEFSTAEEGDTKTAEYPSHADDQKHIFDFDPNTCPADSLKLLPLPESVIGNLLKYRSKGGHFQKAEDLKKIYGMEKFWKSIDSHVKIEKKQSPKSFADNVSMDQRDSSNNEDANSAVKIEYSKNDLSNTVEKADTSGLATNKIISNTEVTKSEAKSLITETASETPKLQIELNSTDQYELMTVRGIGAYYAKLIINYRDRIGGFVNKEQVLEISGIKEERAKEWLKYLYVDQANIKKLDLNMASFKQLAGLPTIGYKKAEIVKLYQKNNGDYKTIADLEKVGIFRDQEIGFLQHYLVIK